MRQMKLRLCVAAMTLLCGMANAAMVTVTTDAFRLSIKHDGVRESAGDETLTYSSRWDGGDGATVTIAQDGTALVQNLSGEGERAWSVRKTGTYTISHTTYTNGVAGKVETATFVVPGPELTFEYDGGQFVGGTLTINGNLDGWTVYYTTDGSTPTTESTEYTGPFTLSAAATVKAFAVSGNGLVTEVFGKEYAVVEHARIENVRARQRWPWNGKVDIDFDVVGDVTLGLPEETYVALLITATNRVDGTNYVASMAALSGDTGTAAGAHRVTWDMNAQGLNFASSDVVFSVGYTSPKYCIIDLSGGAEASDYPVTYVDMPPVNGFNTDEFKTTKLALQLILPGTFIIGDVENLAFQVSLTKPFFMGIFEVTQKQYELVMGTNHSASYTGDMRPVDKLSYELIRGASMGSEWPVSSSVDDASFLGVLRARTGINLDLPTNAQWEYACRAGTSSLFNNGGSTEEDLKLVGRYSGNQSDGKGGYSQHTVVGSYQPNAWGLYDMHGNVWEWCLDWNGSTHKGGEDPVGPISGVGRVLRGGNWHYSATFCTSFYVIGLSPGIQEAGYGLRLALTLPTVSNYPIVNLLCESKSLSANLDLRNGTRASLGDEMLTYSSQWDGGDGATVTIAQDGAALAEGLTGDGERAWSVTRNGTYVLTHTTYTNGVAGKVETATFVVTGKDMPFAEGDVTVRGYEAKYDGTAHGIGVTVDDGITGVVVKYATAEIGPFVATAPALTDVGTMTVWCEISAPGYITQTNSATVTITKRALTLTSGSASKVYDGTALTKHEVAVSGDGFAGGEGATYNVTGSQITVGEHENTFTYTLNANTKVGNYEITAVNGTLTVTKATSGGAGGEEPGGGVVPQGGESKFDVTVMYDGEGHAIDTNALMAAFGATMIGGNVVVYASDDGSGPSGGPGAPALLWGAVPVYTNVGEHVVWYRVSNPNYEEYVHAAKLTITKRPVTLTSKSDVKVYDGTPLTAHEVSVGGDGFVGADGANYAFTGSQTEKGASKNAFTYTLKGGTNAAFYDITKVEGDLEVTAADISQGDEADWAIVLGPALTYTGLEQIQALASVEYRGLTVDCSIAGNAQTDAGSYTMTLTGQGNFSGTRQVAWSIAPKALTLTAGSGSRVYDGTALTIGTVTAVGFVAGEGAIYQCAGSQKDVGSSVNEVSAIGWFANTKASNYDVTKIAGTLTITARPVTVTVTGHTETYAYDTTEKTVTGYDIATGDSLYDTAADTVFGGVALASRTDVGTAAMGLVAADFSNKDANFLVTYAVTDGWVKIEPRVIGDDPANWDIRLARNPMYDGTEQLAPITQVAFVKPDGNLDNIPYALSGNVATNAGNYVVRIAGTGNYSGMVEKEWAITPRNVTLASGSAEWVYDGTAHSHTSVTVTGDGFADGEGASYSGFPVVRHVADAVTPTANAFAYTLDANTKAQNYVITTANGTVRMTPRAVTLTSPTKSRQYDGTALTFTAAEVTATLTNDGQGQPALPDGEAFALSDFASITEAGRVNATFTISDDTALMNDYVITTAAGTLTVTRNATEITVTAKSGSWVYDGQPHTLHEYEATNLGVLQAGDALAVAFGDDSIVTTPIDGEEQNGVVPNAIAGVRVIRNGTDDVTANYTLTPYNGTLTVTKRPVTLTSKSDVKVYDGTPLTAHEVTVSGDGFVGADGATYSFTGSQTERGASKNAFAHTLKGGTNAAFYDITKVEGDLEVTAADISQGDEADWAIVLGPALTYTGLEQIQTLASVTYKGLPLDYSVTGNAQTDAGTYQMTLTGQGNFSGTHQVAWSIAPKALTLTAESRTKVYDGSELRNLAATADGFVAGEGVSAVCSGSITDVGSCDSSVIAIYWDGKTKASNYVVTKIPGTLTVTPRPVTVTSKNISKPYDGTPLRLSQSDIYTDNMVVGEKFIYGDLAERTEAGQSSASFTVAGWNGSKLSNYSITTVFGTITIMKSATAISVTAASDSWVYDSEAHSNRTWTAANLDTLQSGDVLEVTFDEASVVTTPQDGPAQDGVVANAIAGVRVIRNGSEDVTANYTVEWFPGTLTVTKRPVTVTVAGHTATYAYDGTEKTATGYDVSTEDALYDITADTVFSGVALASRTDAGKTNMGLAAADFSNNNANFLVTYAVADGWVEIGRLDITDEEAGAFVLALGANPKYNGTVQTIAIDEVSYKGLAVTCTFAGENATHAGAYTLTVKANGNFTGERSTTWQVLKRAVTLTSGSASKVYDGTPLANPSVAIGGDGFIGLEGATFDVTGSQTAAGTSKNAFTYALKAGTQSGDYDITKVEGDLTVTKAVYPGQEPGGAGIRWSAAADAATWMYDGQAHGVALVGVPDGVTARLSGNTATDAGEYTASAELEYDAANYEPPAAPAPLAWSITPRPISLQTVNAQKPYDGFPLSVDVANITPGLSGYAAGECFDYYDLASITEVGETAATFSYRDSATAKVVNYAVTVIGGATLKVTVGGDQISVTAKDGTWAYDGGEHRLAEWTAVNADKLLEGHELQVKVSDASAVTTPRDGVAGDGVVSNAFEYVRIVDTASGADVTRNYNLFVYEGRLQVTNACIGAEMLDGTGRIEKVYDGAATGAVVTATLLQPATVRYWLDGEDAVATPPQFTDAGDYAVWYEVAADYYDAYTGRVDVAIAKRPVTLVSPTKAKPYDGTSLTFGAAEISVGGDGCADGESFAFSNFAGIVDAGRVDAAFDYAAGADTDLGNYEVTVVKGTLTVTASADEITVTAKSGSWPFDAQAHSLHECEVVNGEVLQDGDELVVEYDPASTATTPDDGEVVNRIASVRVLRGGAGGDDVTANYSIAAYPGTIKVVNADVSFGEIDPAAFSTAATYDGEGHTVAVTAPALLTAPVAVAYSASGAGPWKGNPMSVAVTNAGTHTIRYRISAQYYNDYYGEATVTISPREVTLLSASAEKVFDGTPLRLDEVSVKEGSAGFVAGEGVNATCISAQTGVGKTENGFTYEFRAGTLADNYTIVPEFGWLEVTPGTLSVDLEQSNYAGVYDGSPHGVTPAFAGTGLNPDACEVSYALVGGDESAYTAEAPTFTDVGTYTVHVKIKAQNFAVVYTEMTVAITVRPVTVTVTGHTGTFTYDTTEKSVSGYEATTADALYDIAADTAFGGVAVAKRTDVGIAQMGLKAEDFANNNANFAVTYLVTDGWVEITSTREMDELVDAFDGLPVTVAPDGEGGWTVTITNDIDSADLPIEIPDNLGKVTIDLNGHDLSGADGADGNDTTPGGAGQPAIVIVPGDGEGDPTELSIVTTGGDAAVKGGDGGDGNPGGNGAPAIAVADDANDGVLVNVGEGVTVRGGDGGASDSGDGGNGGAGIAGNVGTNDGTIIGGSGGSSVSGDGGNGGPGVDGNVDVNNGAISGGASGGSESGEHGSHGEGVTGEVGTDNGVILPYALADEMVGQVAGQPFTGAEVKPVPDVYDSVHGRDMVEGVDYALSWKDNIWPGTASVTVTGIGDYVGLVTRTFTIGTPVELTLKAGEYFKATLAELGYDVPTDGTPYSVVAKGLPAGLKLKYNAAWKNKKGKVVIKAKSEWWIEGVPTAALDFFTNPPYLVITANGRTVTVALPVEVLAQDVVVLDDLALGQSVNTNGYLAGVTNGWKVSGLPKGLKYTAKRITEKLKSGKKTRVVTKVLPYSVYGKTTKAGLFTITAKKKVGAFYETKKFRVLVRPAAVDKALFGEDLTNITTMAYAPINWDLTGGVQSVPPVPFVPSSIGGNLAKVTGLPTGLTFAAKDAYAYTNAKKKKGKYLKQKGQTIVGTPTKTGTYVVTFTKNVKSGKKTVARTAQILWVVTQNDAELSLGFNNIGGVIESGVVGLKYADMMAFAATSNATVTASGLPAGIKLVKLDDGHAGRVPLPGFATWGFQGFTAKAGTYLVTVKATLNGKTITQRVALKVDGLPAWAKGTFNGYVAGEDGATNGLATVTVSAAGKVSGKFYDRGTNWTFTAASYTAAVPEAASYSEFICSNVVAKFAYKVTEKVKGKKKTVTKYVTRSFTLTVAESGTRDACPYRGVATLEEVGGGSTVRAWQNLWGSTCKALGKKLFSSKSGKKTLAYRTFVIKSTDPAGAEMGLTEAMTLSLKVTTSGAVTATMSFDTGKKSKGKAVIYKATCSTVVIPLTEPTATEFKGFSCLYFAPSMKNNFLGFAAAVPF